MAEQKHRGPMGGGPRGMMPGEKAKDFKGTMENSFHTWANICPPSSR